MKKTNIISIVAILVLGWNLIAVTDVFALNVRFSQQIQPVPCGVDKILDIDGTEHYVTPRACPAELVQPTTSTTITSGGGSVLVPQPIYLETRGHMTGDRAYIIVAKPGQMYSFRLQGDGQLVSPRTMEVLQATVDGIMLRFRPGDKQIVLQNAARLSADIAFDTRPDVEIIVQSIDPQGEATLYVWFPADGVLPDAVRETKHSYLALILTLSVGIGAIYIHWYHRWRRFGTADEDILWRTM